MILKKFKDIKVGDKVIGVTPYPSLSNSHKEFKISEYTVANVGRTILTVIQAYKGNVFSYYVDMKTGEFKEPDNGWCFINRLEVEELIEEKRLCSKIAREFNFINIERFSLKTLRDIYNILVSEKIIKENENEQH